MRRHPHQRTPLHSNSNDSEQRARKIAGLRAISFPLIVVFILFTQGAALSTTEPYQQPPAADPRQPTMSLARRGIAKIVTAHQQREGGGFLVRRPIGGRVSELDPFLMLDHLGPVVYAPGEAVGAPDHPHRGFETVTYVLDGGFHHQDSQGNEGNLGPGWVQWMTAGSGVVHSEMPTDKVLEKGGPFEGFQLWVNLPAAHKMKAPRYQDTAPEKMPIVEHQDGAVWIRVIAGDSSGTSAVIETHTPILFLDIRLKAGAAYTEAVPKGLNAFVYVYRGTGLLGEEETEATMGQVAVLEDGEAFDIKAPSDDECRVLLIAGEPIGEPVARYGPFVMNTYDEIEQAFRDYRSGKLGEIAGSEERYAKTQAAVRSQKESGNWDTQESVAGTKKKVDGQGKKEGGAKKKTEL